MALTPAQEAAVKARNPELLVSAAAGSGKTRVLIERIYHMIHEEGFSLDRLLIVTFTHAAAAEMRERLQVRLTDAAAADPRMRRQAELLETAQISTLHSFCLQLVRAYFQEVDIDPQAAPGDEVLCRAMLDQARGEAMERLYEQAAAGEPNASAITGHFEDAQIERMLSELYPFLMALPDPFGWLAACAEKNYTVEDLRCGELAETLREDCQLIVSGMEELAESSARLLEIPLFPTPYQATVRSDAAAVDRLAQATKLELPQLIAAARAFALDRLPSVRNLAGEEADLRDRYKANREQMKKLASGITAKLPETPEVAIQKLNAMQPSLRGLASLTRDMDERYASLKREHNLLDFADLERMALRILRNPSIQAEVATRYDGVFVDEYQDVSAVQEAILQALRRDVSRETSGLSQRYFYVGDVKQSIYRFRQADPTLFMEKARTFSSAQDAPRRRITLNANFRSREAVLSGVNRVFERVMRADVTEIDYDAEARLYPGVPSTEDPPVSLHLFTQTVKAAERARLEAYAIGRQIRARVGQPVAGRAGEPAGTLRYRDIAILAPRMKDVSAVLERTFQEMGIPVYCEDRGSALESEEITQALNHLRLMDNLADDLTLLACLRSPAMGLTERDLAAIRLRTPTGSYLTAVRAAAEAQDALGARCRRALDTLSHERFLLMETPLDAYLWGWLNRSGMYAFWGCQPNGALRQANLRMLCEKAGDHVRRRGGELRDFLNSVEAQAGTRGGDSPTVLSPYEDVVRVMTIHKSKGLEFPVVFVMGLEDTFSARRGGALAAHARLGVALPYVNPETRTTGDTLLKAAVDLRAQREERAERARLLYVAMTRAREELVLLGCGRQLAPEEAAQGFPQNRDRSAYAIFSANSMLSWVCGCMGAEDDVRVAAPTEVSDTRVRRTELESGFSTQSTDNPHFLTGWTLVFHNSEEEIKEALRMTRGAKALTDLELRRARLNALAEEVRRLALSGLSAAEPGSADLAKANPVAAAHGQAEPSAQGRLFPGFSQTQSASGPETAVTASVFPAPGAAMPNQALLRQSQPDGSAVGGAATDRAMSAASATADASALSDASATADASVLSAPSATADVSALSAASDTADVSALSAVSATAAQADAPIFTPSEQSGFPHASRWEHLGTAVDGSSADPLTPTLCFAHHPLKAGVTALVRAAREARSEAPALRSAEEADDAALENPEVKRLPLPLTRPRLMSDLPATPAFLRPPAEQTGLLRGMATHKALSLLDFAALGGALGSLADARAEVERQLAALAARRLLTPEEAHLANPETMARFAVSPCGREALASPKVRREWSFNLRLPEWDGMIVQGVIDLCYLREGQWSLVDYKTDRVESAEALWALYGDQVSLYRRALTEATGYPVRDTTLFSLALGEASSRA